MNLKQLRRTIFNGKNPKFVYYISAYIKTHVPRCLLRPCVESLDDVLRKRSDREYILDRMNYYCKDGICVDVNPEEWQHKSVAIGRQPRMRQKVYWYDSMQYARYFATDLRWHLLSGDINYVPQLPSIVKSRPIDGDNRHSVLLKLNKVRHFIFVDDHLSWRNKVDAVVFRGKVKDKEQRVEFMQRWFGKERVDAGAIDREPSRWTRPKMTIAEHLAYRYIMAIEGNDVASNLKWVMSSNSIAVMPRPTCETWFMEGRLVPNYHYIEVRPDFADLEERLAYYSSHPNEAEAIIRHAHEWVEQFRDAQRERLLSLLVLRKYFDAVATIQCAIKKA